MRVHPFSSDGGFSESQRIPEFCLGFPGAFHCTILSYYGCQVSEVFYVTMTYGVEDSLVRAIVAKERNCVFLAAVLNLIHHKEESGPIMMYCFMGLLPDVGKIAYVWVGGWN